MNLDDKRPIFRSSRPGLIMTVYEKRQMLGPRYYTPS